MLRFRLGISFNGIRGQGFVCVQGLVAGVLNLVRWCINDVVRQRDTIF